MKIDKSGLAYRLLVPLFAVIALVTVILLLFISQITDHIINDYYEAMLASYSDESKLVLDSALAELSTARLLDNRTVTDAKQQVVLEALQLTWKARGIDGIAVGPDGKVLVTTLRPEPTTEVLARPINRVSSITDGPRHLHSMGFVFAPWNWKIYLATSGVPSQSARHEALLLVPMVALGSFLMVLAFYVILQRRLRGPVASMIGALNAEQTIAATGVSEFDQIGSAINGALDRVKERTDAVLRRDEQIKLLLDSTAEGIYGVDLEGNCTFSNRACLRMLGYDREEELLGKNIHVLCHHSYADGRAYPHEDCLIYSAYRQNHEVHTDREVFWKKDGAVLPVEYWSYPIIKDGQATGAVVTFIDTSERLRSEAVLREERNKFEAIIAAIGDGISIQDRNYRVLYQNEVHKKFLGTHTGEYCYAAYRNNAERCEGCQVAMSYEDGQVHTREQCVRLPDGEQHFEITASPLRDASGAIVAGIELVRDITERKRTESQLRQAQKMDAVGRLAGGIAHDFNNVLSAIVGYGSLLRKKVEPGSQPAFFTEQIMQAAERATSLTRQILAFSRKQVLDSRPVGLNAIVHGMEPFMSRVLGEEIEVRTVLADQEISVQADVGQLEQVLMNLATNARDAMPAGGKLIIMTEAVSLAPAYAAQSGLDPQTSYAALSVSDTGTGMDEAIKMRIFDPFFTTKEPGKGTGLGLAIVYGIVKQHQGHISVYSEPGKGTTFRIYLPLASREARARGAETKQEVRGGTEAILLAEDNTGVAGVLKLSLEEYGYRVFEAGDGEEAVRLFRDHADEIKLCLFDVIMPKKNGKEAFEEIAALRPVIKVIYMSGYTADVIEAKDLVQRNSVFISKPVFPDKLLALIREVLERK